MDFDLTERERFYRDRVRDFIETRIRPRNGDYKSQLADGDRWQPIPVIEELKPEAREAGLWNLFMPPGSALRHVDESFAFEGTQLTNLEYALCAEEMGHLLWSSGGVQLLGARHRQYGGAAPLRHARAEGAVAEAADERRDPLRLPDDRAGGRLVRRDQHPVRDPARRRRLCDQRPQMVVVRRRRSALQGRDPDGQDRSRRAEAPAAIDGADAAGRARHHGRAGAHRLRL